MLNDVVFNNEKSAYDDWNIVLTKAEIPLPNIKTSFVDIKGADGMLDLSEVLTGDIMYSNRVVKLTFSMMDDVEYTSLISEISNYLHGKMVNFKLNNDDCYYVGRATINNWECIKRKGTIVIGIDCEPYKYALKESVTVVNVNGDTKNVYLKNKRKMVCPTLTVDGNVTMTFNGMDYELENGEHQVLNFVLVEGNNLVKFSGNGTVTIRYRMRWL